MKRPFSRVSRQRAASISLMPASLSSFGSRSCSVANMRSERPRASGEYVCLLNNDMVVEPGFLSELRRAFDEVPDLFSSTAIL